MTKLLSLISQSLKKL